MKSSKDIYVNLNIDHKALILKKETIGCIHLCIRFNDDYIMEIPVSIWTADKKGEKTAQANMDRLLAFIEAKFDKSNRTKLAIQGDFAITTKSFLELADTHYLIKQQTNACSNHGGHRSFGRGLNLTVAMTGVTDGYKLPSSMNTDEAQNDWFSDEEKNEWQKPMQVFFKMLASLEKKPHENSITFGTAIHLVKKKEARRHEKTINPNRILSHQERNQLLFNTGLNEKESTKAILVKSDKKQRRLNEMIRDLAESINTAADVAASPEFRGMFPEFTVNELTGEKFAYPASFIKYVNMYASESAKITEIMDSTKMAPDSGLLNQLMMALEMSIGTSSGNFPLKNVLSR